MTLMQLLRLQFDPRVEPNMKNISFFLVFLFSFPHKFFLQYFKTVELCGLRSPLLVWWFPTFFLVLSFWKYGSSSCGNMAKGGQGLWRFTGGHLSLGAGTIHQIKLILVCLQMLLNSCVVRMSKCIR